MCPCVSLRIVRKSCAIPAFGQECEARDAFKIARYQVSFKSNLAAWRSVSNSKTFTLTAATCFLHPWRVLKTLFAQRRRAECSSVRASGAPRPCTVHAPRAPIRPSCAHARLRSEPRPSEPLPHVRALPTDVRATGASQESNFSDAREHGRPVRHRA